MVIIGPAVAVDRGAFDELGPVFDSAKVMEADVFAPKTWEKAAKAYDKAREAVNGNKKQKTINKNVDEAREYVENALKAAEVCKLSLQEYLSPREKAKEAGAPRLVPELYQKAYQQFVKATAKVESGDVKNALKEAEKAAPLFDIAEMEAIRADILGGADRLIQKALADEAGKYALSTLDKARTARKKANAILTNERYNRTEAVQEAKRAEYEAQHASSIAASVRSLNKNDQAWEKLMLVYEIQMNRVGTELGLDFLPFHNGPFEAADTLIARVSILHADNDRMKKESAEMTSSLTGNLQQTLALFGDASAIEDPTVLATTVQRRVSALLEDKDLLSQQVETSRSQLSDLSAEHEEVSAALGSRLEQEKKFKTAKMKLNPSEGEVLFNSSNDIVLRLTGLSFDIGKSDIKDSHTPLLQKVMEVIELFPKAQLVIEGHTDASGDPQSNLQLSEKRAFAVMQYLRQSLLIPSDRIQAIGYGSDRPVASNKTTDGRAKNRRIDIIIMQ
jgi:outer membrane protein OmpA-like peptidoglycan-associated protein